MSFVDLYCSAPTLACYEGEAEVKPEVKPEEKPEVKPEVKPASFNQDQVNKFLAEERRKAEAHYKAQTKTLLEEKETRINDLLADKDLTAADRDRLQADYDKVQDQLKEHRSEKETLLREKRQLEETLTGKAKEAEDRAKSWETRYAESTIQRELQEAAVKNNAFNADQMIALLKPSTKMQPVLDAGGKPTGSYEPVVELDVVKDGKAAKAQFSPAKAVEYMKSLPAQYGNLFKSGVAGGVGGSAVPAGSLGQGEPVDLNNLTQAQYEAIRNDPVKSAAVFGKRR